MMISHFYKALMAALASALALLVAQLFLTASYHPGIWGLAAFVSLITGLAVYLTPNKVGGHNVLDPAEVLLQAAEDLDARGPEP